MKKLLCLLTLWMINLCALEEKLITVVIPSYNNKLWCITNLVSIVGQRYKNYQVIYLDDASQDGTSQMVQEFIELSLRKKQFTYIKNEKRLGALHNIYRAVHMLNDDNIVLVVDGDDWLAHDRVFQRINEIYEDPDVWMTYGQYKIFPGSKTGYTAQIPGYIHENNIYRQEKWMSSHLRTFYAGLFKKIKRDDLMEDGDFYQVTGDQAFMFPLIEMAGIHSAYIDEILYCYNLINPLNDIRQYPDIQLHKERDIRRKTKYRPLKNRYEFIEAQK